MPYVAPSTVVAGQTYSAASHNIIVNDVIDLDSRLRVVTSSTRPGSPTEGMFIYETDTQKTLIYNGSSWIEVSDLDNVGGLSAAVANASTILNSVMPVGSVIQVVNGTYSTAISKSSSSTFTDTNLSVSITPSSTSNKILIIVFQAGVYKTATDITVRLKLLRGVTDLIEFESTAGGTGSGAFNGIGAAGTTYLDSPATTSSVTYKTQYAANSASGTVGLQGLPGLACTSTITAMEIRA